MLSKHTKALQRLLNKKPSVYMINIFLTKVACSYRQLSKSIKMVPVLFIYFTVSNEFLIWKSDLCVWLSNFKTEDEKRVEFHQFEICHQFIESRISHSYKCSSQCIKKNKISISNKIFQHSFFQLWCKLATIEPFETITYYSEE